MYVELYNYYVVSSHYAVTCLCYVFSSNENIYPKYDTLETIPNMEGGLNFKFYGLRPGERYFIFLRNSYKNSNAALQQTVVVVSIVVVSIVLLWSVIVRILLPCLPQQAVSMKLSLSTDYLTSAGTAVALCGGHRPWQGSRVRPAE